MAKAVLIPGKEKRVLGGHPWVFRSDIAQVSGTYEPGDVLDVVSEPGPISWAGVLQPQIADFLADDDPA